MKNKENKLKVVKGYNFINRIKDKNRQIKSIPKNNGQSLKEIYKKILEREMQ